MQAKPCSNRRIHPGGSGGTPDGARPRPWQEGAGEDRDHLVAGENHPFVIDRDETVPVAIESQPKIGFAPPHLAGEGPRMLRTAATVDIDPIRGGVDGENLRPQTA